MVVRGWGLKGRERSGYGYKRITQGPNEGTVLWFLMVTTRVSCENVAQSSAHTRAL